jgi:hypothetical protein
MTFRRWKNGTLTVLAVGAVAGMMVVASAALAGPPPPAKTCADISLDTPKNSSKVSLCHFTGSDKPFVFNEVSVSGAASHLDAPDHHGDCGLYGVDAHTDPSLPGGDRAGTTFCNLGP